MLRVAVPNKGTLSESAAAILVEAGLHEATNHHDDIFKHSFGQRICDIVLEHNMLRKYVLVCRHNVLGFGLCQLHRRADGGRCEQCAV